MSTSTLFLPDTILDYLRDHGVREAPVLAALRKETASLPMAVMQIAPEQGQLLAMLVRLIGARRTLDIGVFTGYSSLVTALALPEDGQVVALDVSEEWTSMGRRYWQQAGVSDRIDLRLAPALETLDGLIEDGQSGQFDFAFIDADKVNYQAYYERCLRLLRRGGLIAVDNVLWSGRVAQPGGQSEGDDDDDTRAIRAFNQALRDDERIDIAMVPIADGLTLACTR